MLEIMYPATATALVGAGLISVMAFPALAFALIGEPEVEAAGETSELGIGLTPIETGANPLQRFVSACWDAWIVTLLVLFALVAGAGTALSPCVLPVLPAVLSAGVTGGRRRPLGVVSGLALSFTFATVALVYVIAALGLPNDLARTLAIVTLPVFGVILLLSAARRPGRGLDLPDRARPGAGGRGRVRLRAPGRRQPWLRLRALRRARSSPA